MRHRWTNQEPSPAAPTPSAHGHDAPAHGHPASSRAHDAPSARTGRDEAAEPHPAPNIPTGARGRERGVARRARPYNRRHPQTPRRKVTNPETPHETLAEELRNLETAAETWDRSTRPTAGVRTRPYDGCYRGHSWPSYVGARRSGVRGLDARPADPRRSAGARGGRLAGGCEQGRPGRGCCCGDHPRPFPFRPRVCRRVIVRSGGESVSRPRRSRTPVARVCLRCSGVWIDGPVAPPAALDVLLERIGDYVGHSSSSKSRGSRFESCRPCCLGSHVRS